MNKDQWTVLGLIIVLAALEIVRSPNVRGFFNNFLAQFGTKIPQVQGTPSMSPSPPQPTQRPRRM